MIFIVHFQKGSTVEKTVEFTLCVPILNLFNLICNMPGYRLHENHQYYSLLFIKTTDVDPHTSQHEVSELSKLLFKQSLQILLHNF